MNTHDKIEVELIQSYAIIKELNERIARCKCVDCEKISSNLLELTDSFGNFQACICERCNENRHDSRFE